MSRARFKRKLQRLLSPVTQGELRRALEEVTGRRQESLYIHSGISSLGWVLGGPETTIDTLHAVADNLFLPTHTYCYPASPHEPGPIFDRRRTPSEMGLLAETFWRRPTAIRSIHSTHSLAGEGPLAAEICGDHQDCDTPCGEGTPYSKLVHRGVGALMLGVSFRYYTPFHTAEWESGSEFAAVPGEVNRLRFVDENGEVQERLSKRQNRIFSRFHEAGELLEQKGFVRRRPLGRSALLFVPDMSKVHEFLLERLKAHPDFLRSTCTAELA